MCECLVFVKQGGWGAFYSNRLLVSIPSSISFLGAWRLGQADDGLEVRNFEVGEDDGVCVFVCL